MKILCVVFGVVLLLEGCGSDSYVVRCSGAVGVSGSAGVAATSNPQVARYTFEAPGPGTVTVDFGVDTRYGRSTGAVKASGQGPVSVLVAGMLARTTYHMRAEFTPDAGGPAQPDSDQTFTTGDVPCKFTAVIQASTAAGKNPQPGIELVDGLNAGSLPAPVATDLQGNIIWTYPFEDESAGVAAYPVRMLSNGDLLMLVGHNSSTLLADPAGVDAASEVREIDLAGDTVRSLKVTSLNATLAAKGAGLLLNDFSHDILPLSNGHFLVLAATEKSVADNVSGTPTRVLGDAIIDLDASLQPVWTWNTFDHLDVNRHPYLFPDWTHANSVSYDPIDGSLILSLRHQNWVLKIDYGNGGGDGAIEWKLGPGGDFALLKADGSLDANPADWFYSQHDAEYLGTDSSGRVTFSIMDNGDDRKFSDGTSCPVTGGNACYTTIPIMQIDEAAKTAKFLFHDVLPPSQYSFFGGNTEVLANGDVQYDLAALRGNNASVTEVTGSASPQMVWSLEIGDALVYRASRWPSLYPGVQW